jgi:uncharacterized membrane protein
MSKKILGITILLLIVSGCNNYVDAESELASNNVWHAAKLGGVPFRAVGQEPGWLLEIINGESILLTTDYGQTKTTYAYVEPVVDNENRHTEFRVSENTTIIIDGKACTDVMSGEAFEVTVTIKQISRTLNGCGRALF